MTKNFRDIYEKKHKRYLFQKISSKTKRKKVTILSNNLENLLMYDIDKMMKNDLKIDKMDEKTKERLEEQVRILYVKYIFERDTKYIDALTLHIIPVLLFCLKSYKPYFPKEFPDVIHYVLVAITEEFQYLKWSLVQGGFITFISPRVKKFVHQFLNDYQREQEQIQRTTINEEKNFVVTFEKVWKDETEEIKENIQEIQANELNLDIIEKQDLDSLRLHLNIIIENDVKYTIPENIKLMLNLDYFIDKYNDIIVKNDLLKFVKSEKTKMQDENKVYNLMKEVFVLMMEYNLFDKLKDMKKQEIKEKIIKLYNWLKSAY